MIQFHGESEASPTIELIWGRQRVELSGVSRMVEPISKSIKAMPHRPVYSIHRYFARRPYMYFQIS